jgi:hypothetical protein
MTPRVLRRRARRQKQGLAATPRNNRLSNGRAMMYCIVVSRSMFKPDDHTSPGRVKIDFIKKRQK